MNKMKLEEILNEALAIKRRLERTKKALKYVKDEKLTTTLFDEIKKHEKELAIAKRHIEEMAELLPREEMRLMLKYKYIYGFTMETLADTMFFSLRHCYRLNKRAVEYLIWVLDEEAFLKQGIIKKKLSLKPNNKGLIKT